MKTRYPILLVHGLAIKSVRGFRAFGRIDRILRIQGYTVYVSDIDAFGSVETNAEQLKEEVKGILWKENTEKVNIIAHSKGGLDARCMIEHLGMAEHVASLTTLCTPHKGSPIASLFLKLPGFALAYIAFFVDLWCRILGDKAPDSRKVCRELERIQNTEVAAVPIEGVFCQSFSSSIRESDRHRDFIMGIPAIFSRLMEKDTVTDGIVPRDSAIYGKYRGDCIDGSVSHTEIVDFMVRDKYKDQIYAFYSALCEELVQMGM